MRIGKQFIRNYVTEQLKVFQDYMDVKRVDVMVNGKLLGFACKDEWEGGIFYMWKEGGDYARDMRSACQKLRKYVREWVRDVTEAIYARGLEHEDCLYYDRMAINNVLDEELEGYSTANENIVRNSYELDYYDMVNDVIPAQYCYRTQMQAPAVSDLL